jgi:hypothetical protein
MGRCRRDVDVDSYQPKKSMTRLHRHTNKRRDHEQRGQTMQNLNTCHTQWDAKDVNLVINNAREVFLTHGSLAKTASGFLTNFVIFQKARGIVNGEVPLSSLDIPIEFGISQTGWPESALRANAELYIGKLAGLIVSDPKQTSKGGEG